MTLLIVLGAAFCAIASAAHLVSIATVIVRLRSRRDSGPAAEAVSILRPVCGIDNFAEETLRSTFLLAHPRYEIIFCVADRDDPVIPIVQRLIEAHPEIDARLLIGNTQLNANPKLNNLVKGWHASRYDWVLMVDSNVLMPKDYLERIFQAWRPDTGLVCSPPLGCAPANLWSELECAFLNTYQARWQCFADGIGLGFAQGKSMLWRRALLEGAGGIEALARELAEDAAATKIVRGLGLRVRLVSQPFAQPLGYRSLAAVWQRQVRWARLRRITFKLYFVPEIFSGGFAPVVAAAATAAAGGWPMAGTVLPFMAAWYAAEALLALLADWQFSPRSIAVWMLRDALLPLLWIAAWAGNEFEWRGNAMTVAAADLDELAAGNVR
jgi:ceramide glucosyltransferase